MASATIVLVVFVLIASAVTYSASARHTNNNHDDGEGSSRGSPTQPILRISSIPSSPSSSSSTSSASFVRCWGRHCSRKGRGAATVAEQQIPSSVEGRRRWRKGGVSAARHGHRVAATTVAPLAAEEEDLSAHWCDLWVSRGAAEASLLRQVNRTDAMFLVADATWVPEAPLPVEWQRRYNRHHPDDQQRQSTDENCLLSWSQLRHDAPITENDIQGGGEAADEKRHATTVPPQWWQARHNQQQQPTRNLGTGAPQQRNIAHSASSAQMEEHYVGSGWWTCYLPSLPPAVPLELFPRHLELQCGFGILPNSGGGGGGGLHMEITSSTFTHLPCLNNTSVMAPPPPAPLFSCEIVYGLTKHDPSLYFQEGGGEGHDPTLPLPPQSWGSSPLALQWAIGFLVIVAFSFFFSMAYLIASPSYHRKLVSYRLAKKFDELEDWVAKKEDALHHGAEGGSRQHEIASSEASSQGQSKGHRRMQRLAAHGLLDVLEKVDQDAERRNRTNEAHDSSSPLRGSKQQQAAFSSSAVMYQNPAKRTLGELLEDSRRETHQPPMRHNRNHAAAAQHSFESAPNFSAIGAVHSSSSSSSMSQQDRHYWDDHSSSNSGLRQRPPASNHHDHHHQRHHVSTVSPVVSAAQVDSFPIDGAWVD
ncbi:GPI-anchored surface protein, putative [Bodo saltans]|uniref:GPI-anchored surface protein, putative n=1 Tax=Bodo saltans TaxID=75058 RepID=A0A0S4IIS2_BODSA|nr:GPI-anchored surface protein, putative [Bodo saltans]|eukprot:CUE72971.1 GPI-anchored surface protein, putative [Bodo saltans]